LTGCFVPWQASKVPNPKLLQLNQGLALELGLDVAALASEAGVAFLSGNALPAGAHPLAQVYAGHQFGGFSPQLGDGRALLLGEVLDVHGQRRDLAFKGSGPTPFSRGGDGKAALGPVLREYLMGEAMHALGIPTTRALAVVGTGEMVFRDDALPGALLTRVAASHLRVGTFQFFAARGDADNLKHLADFAIARHDPELQNSTQPYLDLLKAVCQRQARLIAQWMTVGFVHGVMNTDNMTLSGETIDYGPCAMMDLYDPGTVFSSIDRQGRYAYRNQPPIARWNLARLGETLLPLISDGTDEGDTRAVHQVIAEVDAFHEHYEAHWLSLMRCKLGLFTEEAQDLLLAKGLLVAMEGQSADYTQVMRALSSACLDVQSPAMVSLFDDATPYLNWAVRWHERMAKEDAHHPAPNERMDKRVQAMNQVNPLYIARNHKVEEALAAAVREGDLHPFETLLALLRNPFVAQAGAEAFTGPAPLAVRERYQTFCGT
jgi:uncharacterized protein YdiU (UPF0061 family)